MNTTCQKATSRPKRGLDRLWTTVVTVGLAAVLAAACTGGGDGDGSATPVTTAQATGEPTASAACQALASLNSYRYVSKVTLESPEEIVEPSEGQPTPVATLTREFHGRFYFGYVIEAAVVAPDRIEALMVAEGLDPVHVIAVGDSRWVSHEEQWLQVGPSYEVPYKPMDICNSIFPELDLDQAQGNEETVNNVPAQHYAFPDTPSGQAITSIFGPGSDMDILLTAMDVEVWVAEEDGWPVRMDIQSRGLYGDRRELRAHVSIELREVNSKDIRIEPPF